MSSTLNKKIVINNNFELFKFHLSCINLFIENKLTEKEIEVAAIIADLDYNGDVIFSKEFNTKVKSKLKIAHSNYNFYVRCLEDKGVIKDKKLNKSLFPNVGIKEYKFLIDFK